MAAKLRTQCDDMSDEKGEAAYLHSMSVIGAPKKLRERMQRLRSLPHSKMTANQARAQVRIHLQES